MDQLASKFKVFGSFRRWNLRITIFLVPLAVDEEQEVEEEEACAGATFLKVPFAGLALPDMDDFGSGVRRLFGFFSPCCC